MAVINPDVALRFHTGDLEALREIVDYYQNKVFRIGLKLLGKREDAADFSQDAFLRAYEKRSYFDPARPFEPWFYKVAVNVGRERLRRRREIPSSDVMPELRVEAIGEKLLLDQERRARVWQALQELKPNYRECLILRFESDLRLHEIAQTLGLSLGTVKTRLRRGLMAFKNSYQAQGGDHSELQEG
ncbi:sigma-70 family RNA polymerase sigma factor [bacterium]|nr:sigma-70 family RNA polymerase sigma factor [bacterium]